MFDAHRHLTGEKEPYDALYCTSHQDEWTQGTGLAQSPRRALGPIP
jgi:hypothetical protein